MCKEHAPSTALTCLWLAPHKSTLYPHNLLPVRSGMHSRISPTNSMQVWYHLARPWARHAAWLQAAALGSCCSLIAWPSHINTHCRGDAVVSRPSAPAKAKNNQCICAGDDADGYRPAFTRGRRETVGRS
eukprot:353654-Chlamydomonas_euryale.AAC.3